VKGSSGLDRFLLERRTGIAVTLAVFFGIALVTLVSALFANPIYGVTVSDSLTALLALGTLTLAYAAVVQAVLSAEQRRANVSPKLDLRVTFADRTIPSKAGGPPIVYGQFDTSIPMEKFLRLVVRNIGSGSAISVDLSAFYWVETIETVPSAPLKFRPTMDAGRPFPFDIELFSLSPNEEQYFILPLLAGKTEGFAEPSPPFKIRRQFVFSVKCTDVEGNTRTAPELGFYLGSLKYDPSNAESVRYNATWNRLATPVAGGLVTLSSSGLDRQPSEPRGV
jgi:hypothetical protein